MRSFVRRTATPLTICLVFAGTAAADEIDVVADITTDTTWTADNTYNLTQDILVTNGATLTIQPGVVIASDTGSDGSLAITRGSKINAKGTPWSPIIFTSKADVATWDDHPCHPTGKDPLTGNWRAVCLEWGSLAIMGRAYISEGEGPPPANSATCAATNDGQMEGLAVGPDSIYGGGDDDDDSGCLSYVSLRYGGRETVIPNSELNGLSLGGVGRETDIDHIEIMNNVDDGIEIWGGTVNLKYFSIWNIGDDSLDVDQGWRGKAQFGLIVQGYSRDAGKGSGTSDNCLELDGAEQSDYQPVTTAAIYNLTVIGQPHPAGSDHGTAWRDNARVQIRNSIFMDLGDDAVFFEDDDGDDGLGYGHNGTLSWIDTWNTAWNAAPAHANDCTAAEYLAQVDGRLAEIRDTVFFNNNDGNAYAEAMDIGQAGGGLNIFTAVGYNNVLEPAGSPIQRIVRGANVMLQGGTIIMQPVTSLDPRPANDALASVGAAPNDGFFTPAMYRGAFAPGDDWLCKWSAADAYGFLQGCPDPCDVTAYCDETLNANNVTDLCIDNCWLRDGRGVFTVSDTDGNFSGGQFGYMLQSMTQVNIVNPPGAQGSLCVAGGTLCRYNKDFFILPGGGAVQSDLTNPVTNCASPQVGQTWNWQAWHRNGMNPSRFSHALTVTYTN